MFLVAGQRVGFAANQDAFEAVRTADQQRIAATISRNTEALGSLLSDDLLYANSDGRVQTKSEFLTATRANTVTFLSVSPHNLAFQQISPNAIAMNGLARVAATVNGQRVDLRLRFLAVWREESGHWKLLSYQSSQLAGK